MTFHERIKQSYKDRRVSQWKWAIAFGIDTASYCKKEKGERRVQKEHISIIANFLQANEKELASDIENCKKEFE
jgi:hypothetical protein